jgi:RNA polymerase sigma-70 factor (ECF subfamily)
LTNTDEHKLITLACKGYHPAMEELYMKNKEKIYNLAYRYVGNRQDAEDLLQEIFARAFIALVKKKFNQRAGVAFSTWLYRIGINCSISYLRKNKKFLVYHQEPMGDTDPIDTTGSDDPGPEYTAVMNDMNEKVTACLNDLSAKQRMIFVLRFYEGLQVKDIAQHMECSEGSVKKQLHRAVTGVRKKLTLFTEGTHHVS